MNSYNELSMDTEMSIEDYIFKNITAENKLTLFM